MTCSTEMTMPCDDNTKMTMTCSTEMTITCDDGTELVIN